jgi:hypothetical protein
MPVAPLIPAAAEAAVFTLGSAFIHACRHRAERLTDALAVVVVMALLGVAFLTTPEERLNRVTEAVALAELGVWIPLQPE